MTAFVMKRKSWKLAGKAFLVTLLAILVAFLGIKVLLESEAFETWVGFHYMVADLEGQRLQDGSPESAIVPIRDCMPLIPAALYMGKPDILYVKDPWAVCQ